MPPKPLSPALKQPPSSRRRRRLITGIAATLAVPLVVTLAVNASAQDIAAARPTVQSATDAGGSASPSPTGLLDRSAATAADRAIQPAALTAPDSPSVALAPSAADSPADTPADTAAASAPEAGPALPASTPDDSTPDASTPDASADPITPASSSAGCTVSPILVPSCGAWWGVSPGGTGQAAAQVAEFERLTSARTDIFHGYHQFGDLFPTAGERAIANDPRGKRLLLFSLMPTTGGRTWAQVAAGAQDAYLTQLASYLRTTYRSKLFITLHHEPENDVIPRAGSGMQATDFHNMFRHVVLKMRALGATNIVWVVTYQGVQSHKLEPWWPSLYPGDDVVDWIGFDIYSCVDPPPGAPCIDYSQMVNRRYSSDSPWVGMYNWATRTHPGTPIMIPEIGVYDVGGSRKADAIRSIGQQVARYPAIKAISYWNSGEVKKSMIQYGQGAVAAARSTATNPWFRQSVG